MALVELVVAGPVAHVALNDPDRRNALGEPMFDALADALSEVREIPDVAVLRLTGRGRVFCAGFDLAAAAREPVVMAHYIERLGQLVRVLRTMPPVVIGAVRGAAIAGGCAVVTACDLVVASATARLGYPVHAIGVSPAVTIPTLLPLVGAGAARSLLLGGELIDGVEAHRLGLVSELAPDDEAVESAGLDLAGRIAASGATALRATKAWINELGGVPDERAAAATADSAALARTEHARARLAAALAGRFGR